MSSATATVYEQIVREFQLPHLLSHTYCPVFFTDTRWGRFLEALATVWDLKSSPGAGAIILGVVISSDALFHIL